MLPLPLSSFDKNSDSSLSLLHNLDSLRIGQWDLRYHYVNKVRNTVTKENVLKLEFFGYGTKFDRRITSLCWHPKFPFTYAAGSKFGDIVVGSVERRTTPGAVPVLQDKANIKGSGAGGSITAMLFDENDQTTFYRTSIDGTASKIDLIDAGNSVVYFDTGTYEDWFTSMDVNFRLNIVAAGANKGLFYVFTSQGEMVGSHRLHKSKIHHIEFSKKDPNLFVTTATSEKAGLGLVKVWDIRKIKLLEPLIRLPHKKGVNAARFNPVDGSRLMTSDQGDEIRIYQGPLWTEDDFVTIKHHHNQFQHLTPIKAEWHPLDDLIVIGKYPKYTVIDGDGETGQKVKRQASEIPRSVEFFNPNTGKFVGEIYPPLNEIVSLNVFNPTGDYLASGMNSKLLFWKPSLKLEQLDEGEDSETLNISEDVRNAINGRPTARRAKTSRGVKRPTREFSPTSDDDTGKKQASKQTKRAKQSSSTTRTCSTTTAPKTKASSSTTAASSSNIPKSRSSTATNSSVLPGPAPVVQVPPTSYTEGTRTRSTRAYQTPTTNHLRQTANESPPKSTRGRGKKKK